MKKITINMLSMANKVDGQGVGSAYIEQVNLVKGGLKDLFEVKINDKKDADIIHCHTVEPRNYIKMMKTKGVTVAYVHFLPTTLDGSINLPKFAFNIFKKYVIKFYNKAKHLVVVNPTFIDELVKNNIKREKIVYIPNYVSKEKFYKLSDIEINKIRNKYGYKKDDFIVLGVGQVQTRKGVLDFIDVAKKMPDVKFIWCGGFSFGKITDGYDELKKVYDNPPENVKFLGIIKRDEMNDIYNISNLLFMPSYNELFPMSILEAVNSQKPLLLRDLDLYKDILFEKYLYANDVLGFEEKIKDLIKNKELYKKYSTYSKEISEFYSKENVLNMWKKFYLKIYNEK